MTEASNPLARLIDATKEANRWSDTDIVRQAKAAGHQVEKSNISRVRNQGAETIRAPLIRALAAGLGLPLSEVLRATLETLGLPAGQPPVSPEQAVQRDPDLPAVVKRQMLALLKDARSAPRTEATVTELKPDSGHGARTSPVRRRTRSDPAGTPSEEVAALELPGVKKDTDGEPRRR